MTDFDYDLITIGAGSGGIAASRRAARHGAKVAICEARELGGTCVLRGCVPKKLLMYGTGFADAIEDARGYGWSIESAVLDWPKLMQAKRVELSRLQGVYDRLLTDAGVEIVRGHARLTGADEVSVGGRRLRARHVLIATGGRPTIPDFPGAELAITSEGALDLDHRPDRMLIVGGGYVAAELASVFRSAGTAVELAMRRDRILAGFDVDVSRALTEAFLQRGMVLRATTTVQGLEAEGRGVAARLSDGTRGVFDVVLVATGREPAVEGLGLEDLGVVLGRRGEIVVDEFGTSNVSSIHAVGDVTDRKALTPVAIAEGRALSDHLFGSGPWHAVRHGEVPSAVFSQPPVATVGLTADQARLRGRGVTTFVTRFTPMKHVLAGRRETVTMKLVVDEPSDVVLGIHVVGSDAPELIQGFALALRLGARKADIDGTLGIHPSVTEELFSMRVPQRSGD